MPKKQKKIILSFCFVCFFCTVIFSFSPSNISATGPEIEYPAVFNQTLGADIKLPAYVKYLFNLGTAIGYFSVFISLIIAGAMYFLSPINAEMKANAKDRVSGAISGLLILTLTYLIVTTINPQLSALNQKDLEEVAIPPVPKPSGIYLYQSGCVDDNTQAHTSSISDLGPFLKNDVNSVGIVQGTDSYIAILYNNPSFWGQCQYIRPTNGCHDVKISAESVSIHPYDFSPNGDGVYFYRKTCFNKISDLYGDVNDMVSYCNENAGGYLKINNSQINNIYFEPLNTLFFNNVPEEEKDCTQYDESGECVKSSRLDPSLGGDNISSMIINGDYLVLFAYISPTDREGTFTLCQEFPSNEDKNRIGPQEIKWQKIKNIGGIIPNYVIIIPIKR